MSAYRATIRWSLGDGNFAAGRYSREHSWSFDGGITVSASSSPKIVPLPYSVENAIDPEEAFVASLASCHMLFFLSLAARERLTVVSYRDEALGVLEEDDAGRLVIARVILRPAAAYRDGATPAPELLERLHHEAHEQCFIANSVRSEVITEIQS